MAQNHADAAVNTPAKPRPLETSPSTYTPSAAYSAMLSSPLASSHSKFPLPSDPGYIKPHVFLGGSCDPTTWRADIAVPAFTKHNIPFFNPQISDWHPNLIQLEAKAKEVCDVLLFVIDSKTRAIASMLEATEYIMSARRVVIVIVDIPEGAKIDGEPIGGRQLKDLNRARAFLCDIAARHQKYCDVFDSIESAVNHIVLTQKPAQLQQLHIADQQQKHEQQQQQNKQEQQDKQDKQEQSRQEQKQDGQQ